MAEATPRAVTVSLTKGGVGKTPVSINLADRLQVNHGDTLLVDLDPAGNATEGVGNADAYHADDHLGDYLDAALSSAEDESPDPALSDVVIERPGSFDLLPSNEALSTEETRLDSEFTLAVLGIKNHVVDPLLGDVYDYIVFDTAPDADSLFREAAILGAGNVVVPMKPGEESVRGLEHLVENEIVPARQHMDVDILAIVPTLMLSDTESRRLVERLADSSFASKLPGFADPALFDDPQETDPGLRKRVGFTKAWREGVPLAEFDPEADMLGRLDALADIVARGGFDA